MIVNGYDRVMVALYHTSYGVCSPFLHFRVGTLNGVQFYSCSKFAGIGAGYCSTAHTNTVVVASKDHDFITSFGNIFYCLFSLSIANTPGLHNYLVVS